MSDPGWTYVERWWPGDPGAPGGKANRAGFTYTAYVPGEIGVWAPNLPAAVAADAARAETAVRVLGRHGPQLRVPTWPLLRSEAIASSRIEGLAVSHHRLALADIGGTDALAKEVHANLAALERALSAADAPVTPAVIRAIHRILLESTRHGAIAGSLRDRQTWIGGRHGNPRGATLVPPPAGDVERLLGDLCVFIDRDDVPPLIQAAVAHVQFETIHPFADGNGRVGRALIHLVLRRRGVIDREAPVIPPISLVIAGSSDAYVVGLSAFRTGDHRTWFEFIIDAAYRAAGIAENLVGRVAELKDDWLAQAGSPRRASATRLLVERLPERPVIALADAIELTGTSHQAARVAINRLAEAGVIREITGKRRLRRWEAVGLFALLDEIEGDVAVRRTRRLPTGSPRR